MNLKRILVLRRMALSMTLAMTLLGGLAMTAMPAHADNDACEKAERERQKAESDRTSDKAIKEAKEKATKECSKGSGN